MNYYLIDLENVSSRGLWGADLLTSSDCIIIFYSSVTSTVDSMTERIILSSPAQFQIQNVNVHTKNAMDFAIAVKAGELLADQETSRIIIVSDDKGYQSVLETGNRGRPGKVCLHPSILEAWYLHGSDLRKEDRNSTQISVKTILKEKKSGSSIYSIAAEMGVDVESITQIIRKADTRRGAYLSMLHAFGKEMGLSVYRQLMADDLLPEGRNTT